MTKQGFVAIACLASCALATPRAQDASETLVFEAASIKDSRGITSTPPPLAPDRFTRSNITLSLVLVYAYQMSEFQIQGGPDWVRTRRFEFDAKAPRIVSADQMRMMVRRLLAERFNLKTRLEARDMPRYALVLARSDKRLGPRLKPSAFDCPAIVAARGPGYQLPPKPPQPGDPPRCVLSTLLGGGSQTMMVEGQPMSAIAKLLQPRAGRVVIDKTGLAGTWDLALETEPQIPPGLGIPADAFGTPREGLSLSTALPEQLGLKLESERGPVDVLVIDSVEPPTPN
jgi:uncharacterized protein (TIGR03435 family)